MIIKEEMRRFYKTLFEEKNVRRPRLRNNRIRKLSGEDVVSLERPFEEEEVWKAICNYGGDRAPVPDGFNFKFFKRFWKVFRLDLMKALHWFWEREEISNECNATFVTLIPKVADPLGLGDFRTISLIGGIIKS